MSADISTAGLQTTETLYSCTSAYSVLEIMGEGCFGKVAKCVKESTKEMVAVKILKNIPGLIQDVDKEEAMLEAISTLNPDKTYLVKFYERFRYMGQTCLVFEMLDINLYTMIEELGTSLYVHDIRPIAHQLLVALDALRGLGIIHSDIKPDNVMVANRKDQNVRAKLIDFGVAKKTRDVKPGLKIQPRGYRAPEVALGLPFNESIDMWGVGCILAYLYLGDHLFSYNCEYQMMSSMVKVLGMPDDELLRSGMYTRTFFTQEGAGDGSSWRLLTPEEFKDINGTDVKERVTDWELPSSLDDLVHIFPEEGAAEFQDRLAFVDLLKQMMHLDGTKRIWPHEALQHPFFQVLNLSQQPETQQNMTVTGKNLEQESDTRCSVLPAGSGDEDLTSWSSFGDKNQVSGDSPPEGSCDTECNTYPGGASLSSWCSDTVPDLKCSQDNLDSPLAEDQTRELSSLSWTSDTGHPSGYSGDGTLYLSPDGAHVKAFSEDASSPALPYWDGFSVNESVPFFPGGEIPMEVSGGSVSVSLDRASVKDSGEHDPGPPDWYRLSAHEDICSSKKDEPKASSVPASAPLTRRQKVRKRLLGFLRQVAATFCCCVQREGDWHFHHLCFSAL